jgi:hypothetical protein
MEFMTKVLQVEHVAAITNGGLTYEGTLHLMTHHIIYSCRQTGLNLDGTPAIQKPKDVWITYHIIAGCTFRPTPPNSANRSRIRIRCRDFTFFSFNFKDPNQAREVYETIRGLTCRLGRIDKLYAFTYVPKDLSINGWQVYDAKAEWKRQGISPKDPDRGWRISRINHDYAFSPTYPALLVVPSTISDNVLKYAGSFRSKVRIPALTYLHPVNNCAITRSAQPRTGFSRGRSAQDEKLVSACFTANSKADGQSTRASPDASDSDTNDNSMEGEFTDTERIEDEMIAAAEETSGQKHIYGAQQHNLIVDARPTVNAVAQQAMGLGSENMDNYKFAAKVYLGIENIHVMRKSLNQVMEALKEGDLSSLPPNRALLERSGWLKHIQAIIDGSALIARHVGIKHSHVLIHCSDGWDRTSQLSALSQIMLDPYYRTMKGFMVLVEKDWLAFGHMFQHRNGYLNSEKWFKEETDGLAGSTVQPSQGDAARNETLEAALAKTKRFFARKPQSDEVDSDGEPIYEDSIDGKRTPVKGTLAAEEATKVNETSPVFHQFLDCTYQLLRQHPARFEFNERFLRRLYYHLYSCQYGTFLYNNEKSRVDACVAERTRSVWEYFLNPIEIQRNKNPQWDGGEVDDHVRGKERLLFPKVGEVKWWPEIFNRKEEDMNGPPQIQPTLNFNEDSGSDGYTGVLKEVETAQSDVRIDSPRNRPDSSPRHLNSGNAASYLGLKNSISNLSIGTMGFQKAEHGGSPAKDGPEMEVEMQ